MIREGFSPGPACCEPVFANRVRPTARCRDQRQDGEGRFGTTVQLGGWEGIVGGALACMVGSPPRLRLTITQGLIPRRRSEEIGLGMRNLFGGRGGGRRDEYNALPDSTPG